MGRVRVWGVAALATALGATVFLPQAAWGAITRETTFTANPASLGPIPDGVFTGSGQCGPANRGAPKDITFSVSGLVSAPTMVAVEDLTFAKSAGNASQGEGHTWVGDLEVTLIAPGGASHVLFGKTGAGALDCGDGSNAHGPYTFSDDAPASPTWWEAAASTDGAIPSGSYRASVPGGPSSDSGENTQITPSFTGVTNPNGVWTLRIVDISLGDRGDVTAASLVIGDEPSGDGDSDGVANNVDNCPFVAGSAADGCRLVTSSLTLRYKPAKLLVTGRVLPAGPCARGRRVVVHRAQKGPDPVVGSARTNAAGKYRRKLAKPLRRGRYYARTATTKRGTTTCRSVRSNVIVVG